MSYNELWCLRVYTFHGELNTRRVVPRRSDRVTKRFGRYFPRRAVSITVTHCNTLLYIDASETNKLHYFRGF